MSGRAVRKTRLPRGDNSERPFTNRSFLADSFAGPVSAASAPPVQGGAMSIDVMKERGAPLEKQVFDWKDIARTPYSKLDDDAYTRVRVILMNGIEVEALRFSHAI